jgi:hypothetical protein
VELRGPRFALAFALAAAACGRIGFDLHGGSDGEPPIEELACNQTRDLVQLPALPRGVAVAATDFGAVVAWSQATSSLSGVRVPIDGEDIGAPEPWTTSLPHVVVGFDLSSDLGDRYLMSVQAGAGTVYVALDSTLAFVMPRMVAGRRFSSHNVAAPLSRGAPFAVTGVEGTNAVFSQLDAALVTVGAMSLSPGTADVTIRGAGRRYYSAWTSSGSGCATWAFEQDLSPSRATPATLPQAGACLQPLMARSGDTNLLVWTDGGRARGQRGTDDNTLGGLLSFGAPTDGVEVAAVAAVGFVVAVAAGDQVELSFVPRSAGDPVSLPSIPHLRSSPIRLIELGGDALLASIHGGAGGAPELQLTRLCGPR